VFARPKFLPLSPATDRLGSGIGIEFPNRQHKAIPMAKKKKATAKAALKKTKTKAPANKIVGKGTNKKDRPGPKKKAVKKLAVKKKPATRKAGPKKKVAGKKAVTAKPTTPKPVVAPSQPVLMPAESVSGETMPVVEAAQSQSTMMDEPYAARGKDSRQSLTNPVTSSEPFDAVEEASEESFPASDPPGHW
jgi:hypothetical protein